MEIGDYYPDSDPYAVARLMNGKNVISTPNFTLSQNIPFRVCFLVLE